MSADEPPPRRKRGAPAAPSADAISGRGAKPAPPPAPKPPRRKAVAPAPTPAAAATSRTPRRPGTAGDSDTAATPGPRAASAKASPRGEQATPAPASAARARRGKAAPATVAAAPAGKRETLKSRYTRAEADALFTRLAEALPEPVTELEYINPFTLLVAVVLSAQATDAGVNKATRPLFAIADTPAKMAELGEDRIREFIKTIGLLNMKAKNVAALSRALVEQHGGEVPHDRAALQALPGVGRKSANVVLNVAFGEPTIAVDTHIFRVGNRLGLAPGRTPDEVEQALEAIVPERFLHRAHHWLILHGRHVCKARRPLCEACVIYTLCKADERLPLPHAPVAP